MAPTNLAIMQAIEDGRQVKKICFDSSAASEYMLLSSLSQSQWLVLDATINLFGEEDKDEDDDVNDDNDDDDDDDKVMWQRQQWWQQQGQDDNRPLTTTMTMMTTMRWQWG